MVKRIFQTKLAITLGLAAMLFAFSNLQIAGQAADSGMPALPFDVVVVRHSVADYSKWKPFFDSDSTNRKMAGLHALGVARGIDNQNEVEIPFIIDDVAKAKAFTTSPKLKDVMQKAGVNAEPNIKFIKVIRMTDAMENSGDYLEVAHKVKDFDAWLKVFDKEGPATRSNDGLQDGVLARGIDDPNLVYLVFMIKDVAKAKAALENPARKKIMQEAGVVGVPEVYFGRDQH